MPSRELVTRERLGRELAVNAATKPLAIGVGAAVAIAAFVIGAAWLLAAAVALYLGLATATFFDGDEAERVGRDVRGKAREREKTQRTAALTPKLALLVQRARAEEQRLVQAVGELGVPYEDVVVEVQRLTGEMERIAQRAQLVATYLGEQRPEDVRRRVHELRRQQGGSDETVRTRERTVDALTNQLHVLNALQSELDRFGVEMEHLIASLAVVRGEVVRMTVAGEAAGQEDVAAQVRELRERVGAISEGISEAVGRLEP
jgi:hypothetical protein